MPLSRNRIEALTDGVFAVAMTLLVLDIKVPELQQSEGVADLPVKNIQNTLLAFERTERR
jgi:uncharacterized membrane protein